MCPAAQAAQASPLGSCQLLLSSFVLTAFGSPVNEPELGPAEFVPWHLPALGSKPFSLPSLSFLL